MEKPIMCYFVRFEIVLEGEPRTHLVMIEPVSNYESKIDFLVYATKELRARHPNGTIKLLDFEIKEKYFELEEYRV